MATRGVEPITLPWKRPEKGVSAAELGASFRVEQREDGWHCTVRVGRRAEVLATGLRRLRDAQCRAEAHAATLPEVAAALAKMKAEAAKPAAKERPVPVPEGRPEPSRRTAAPTFEPISDGCICGKIEGGTWIADPAGKVSVPAGTAPEVAQEICRVAAQHYRAQRTNTVPTPERPRVAARTTAKRKPAVEVEATAPAADATPATPQRARKGKRGKGRTRAARKRLAAKLAGKPGTKASSETAGTVAAKAAAKPRTARKAKVAAKAGKATAKTTTATAKATTRAKVAAKADKATAKTTTTTTAKPTTRVKVAAKAGKATAKTTTTAKPTTRAAKTGGRQRKAGKKAPAAAQAEPQEETMGKKSGKAASKGECGCVAWTEVEGKARGEAKHGAFVVEPEGKKHALYFYDPDGQSRHIQSGEAAKLRKVAEEMAARGQPAPRAASAGDDGALLKMFMAGAMEEET